MFPRSEVNFLLMLVSNWAESLIKSLLHTKSVPCKCTVISQGPALASWAKRDYQCCNWSPHLGFRKCCDNSSTHFCMKYAVAPVNEQALKATWSANSVQLKQDLPCIACKGTFHLLYVVNSFSLNCLQPLLEKLVRSFWTSRLVNTLNAVNTC